MRWVVDYKTGTHEGGDLEAFLDREQERYRKQLEQYAALMRMLDNRPVKLGLYFIPTSYLAYKRNRKHIRGLRWLTRGVH